MSSEEEPIIDSLSGEPSSGSMEEPKGDKRSKPSLMTDLFGAQSDSESSDFGDMSRPARDNDAPQEEEESSAEERMDTSTPTMPLSQRLPEPERPVLQRTVLTELPHPRPPPGSELYGIKLPTSLEIQPLCFDPETYNGDDMKPEFGQDETGNYFLKKTHGDVIRWRHVSQGLSMSKESNSRIVRWSDGSMHLFVGDSSYEIQTPNQLDPRDIFIRQKSSETAESFLQFHGTLTKRMNLIPTDSKKFVKLSRTAIPSAKSSRLMSKTTADFEVDKAQKEKIEQNMLELRRDVRSTGPEMSTGFLEDDEDVEREAERRIMSVKRGTSSVARGGRGGRGGRGRATSGPRAGQGRTGVRVRKRDQYEREVDSEEEAEELDDDADAEEMEDEDEDIEEDEEEEEEDDEEEDLDADLADEPRSKRPRK